MFNVVGQESLATSGPRVQRMKSLDQIVSQIILLDSTAALGNASIHFLIVQPGSHYRTGDLLVSKSIPIRIAAIDVKLDLNGFEISRSSGVAPRPNAAGMFSVELRRGFNAAMYAARDPRHPEKWVANLEEALHVGERNHTNSDAFLLSAQFGLSYRIAEFERFNQPLSSQQLRGLAIQSALARLKCEERKRALGATDAELVRVLRIPVSLFAAWKSSLATTDHDTTVIDARRWLLL
jgi:hypothetical protein